MEERFNVRGKIQGVFFRKSFVFILSQRGLEGGASNNTKDSHLVHCSISGPQKLCQSLKEDLLECAKINSLGANVEEVLETDHGIELREHQASTAKSSKPHLPFGVKVYL